MQIIECHVEPILQISRCSAEVPDASVHSIMALQVASAWSSCCCCAVLCCDSEAGHPVKLLVIWCRDIFRLIAEIMRIFIVSVFNSTEHTQWISYFIVGRCYFWSSANCSVRPLPVHTTLALSEHRSPVLTICRKPWRSAMPALTAIIIINYSQLVIDTNCLHTVRSLFLLRDLCLCSVYV